MRDGIAREQEATPSFSLWRSSTEFCAAALLERAPLSVVPIEA
jgi:hypothetical protein